VPQKPVFGPLLSTICFVTDIDAGIVSQIYKFADVTELVMHAVGDEEEAEILRKDLRRMLRWLWN